ncbi:MAG: DUF1849 family protein [Pseudomonadota bacterium]
MKTICRVAMVAALMLPADGVAGAALASHRAFYLLSLAEAGGGLVDAKGGLALEWRDACEGFVTQQRLSFVALTETGGTLTHDVRFSSFEAADGSALQFVMRSYMDGEIFDDVRGEAIRVGDQVRAIYSEPEETELMLPEETVFPSEHMSRLLGQAAAGDRLVTYTVFDGAGQLDEAFSAVTAVVGEPTAIEGDAGAKAWPMALAYHTPGDSGADLPVFELRFDLTDRGIMQRIELDYGDFALRAHLDDLELLGATACG